MGDLDNNENSTDENKKKSRKLIPWKKNGAWNAELFVPILKLVAIYSSNFKDSVTATWDVINNNVFKQPEFNGYDPIITASLRKQFENMVHDRTKFMTKGNLSKEDGNLSEMDKLVKDYLDAREAEEEEERMLKLISQEKKDGLDNAESTGILFIEVI
jgi:hypothetical protein